MLLFHSPITVQPFKVNGIQGILHALQPITGQLGQRYLAPTVLPGKRLPIRKQWSRLRPHVGEDHSCQRLHRVTSNLDLFFETAIRVDSFLERLLDALSRLIVEPAVIHAAQPSLFRNAVREINASMRTSAFDQTESTGLVFVEDQILPKQTHWLGGLLIELRGSRYGVPIATHQLSHRSARSDSCKGFVLG